MNRTREDPRLGVLRLLQKFQGHVSKFGTETVSGIDRRTRRRLTLVWRADIRDPVFVLHQADTFESHDRDFLRAPGLQHRFCRGVDLVRLFESSSDGEDSSGPSEMSVLAGSNTDLEVSDTEAVDSRADSEYGRRSWKKIHPLTESTFTWSPGVEHSVKI